MDTTSNKVIPPITGAPSYGKELKRTALNSRDFMEAVHLSFSNERWGVLSSFAYDESHDGYIGGGEKWSTFQQKTKKFEILSEEQKVISRHAKDIVDTVHQHERNTNGVHFFDIAPGTACETKTIPIVRAFNDASSARRVSFYTALEINEEFAREPVEIVGREVPKIMTSYVMHDIFRGHITDAIKGNQLETINNRKSVVFYPGATVGNISTFSDITSFPREKLISHLRKLVDYSADESYLIVSNHAHTSPDVLENYSEPENEEFARGVLYRIKNELKTKNFNPENFEYGNEYRADTGLVSHFYKSVRKQTFHIGDKKFSFDKDEVVCRPFNSFKISDTDFRRHAHSAGFIHLHSYYNDETSKSLCTHVLMASPELRDELRNTHGETGSQHKYMPR